ncbi:MAG: cell division protein FtsZ, partial [Burkholderiales bacterium]
QGISVLISETGLVNVDFADVRTVMERGGSALMGTGIGRGENRALEAAQQAIASPLLDNVSITGASGVLVNITGGEDLTLGEVHQINEIVHDAVGDDAEIIFGAVHEPAMAGEIRVTVIATGFDRQRGVAGGAAPGVAPAMGTPGGTHAPISTHPGRPAAPAPSASPRPPAVLPFPAPGERPVRPVGAPPAVTPLRPARPAASSELDDMEIPTFIRRQMD